MKFRRMDRADMLVTTYGESEIIAVTGRDIRCAGDKSAMIGRPYEHATRPRRAAAADFARR
jgi:hypothetical protein